VGNCQEPGHSAVAEKKPANSRKPPFLPQNVVSPCEEAAGWPGGLGGGWGILGPPPRQSTTSPRCHPRGDGSEERDQGGFMPFLFSCSTLARVSWGKKRIKRGNKGRGSETAGFGFANPPLALPRGEGEGFYTSVFIFFPLSG